MTSGTTWTCWRSPFASGSQRRVRGKKALTDLPS
uniref:Uncharacterized protein n=1 Tax=Anguilla anguilla TaxID=7936 RepID=A0A0E9TBU9_ANGAN